MVGQDRYPGSALRDLADLCADVDLIGLSVMTNFFEGAVQITRTLKASVQVPILWGGVHSTIKPEESLDHADMVCVGDGEELLLDLARRMSNQEDFSEIPGLWLRTSQGVKQNPLRPLVQDLDRYPVPDYSLKDHHLLCDGHLVPLTPDRMKAALERGSVSEYLHKIGYQTMTGRGCPHKCTYCINDAINRLYPGQRYLRWRSTEHVMQELSWVKEHMPYVGYIWLSDDAFFARKLEDLEAFCREYDSRIHLPFSCLASPLTITEEKMALLVDAGLVYMQIGIQTGSARIQELYNRKAMDNERMLKAMRIVHRFKDRMAPPSYDFILDVPYETAEDRIASLRLIADMPKPFHLQALSLVLYPGTELYAKAKADQLIGDELHDIYGKSWAMKSPNYLNLLMVLSKSGRFPSFLLRLLVGHPLVDVLNSALFAPVFKALFLGMRAGVRFLKHRGE